MRKQNSLFRTDFISESGMEAWNRTYYGYVELDHYYCLAIAQSHDSDREADSARLAVDTAISLFTQKPSMSRRMLSAYLKAAHEELKERSVKTQLKASLMLLVSDYTRVRYGACGNIMVYWLRDGRILEKNRTHTVYQQMVDQKEVPEDGASGLSEASNVYSFLGSREHFQVFVSSKRKLLDGDLLLAGTETYWKRITYVELLDAFGDMKSGRELLEDLQDMLLSTQIQKSAKAYFPGDQIASYCLGAVFTEKVYRERIKNKKKWIIIGIILILLTAIVVTGMVHINNRRIRLQKELVKRVEQYEEAGSRYFILEHYEAARTQYEKALEEAQNIKNKNKKVEVEQQLNGKTTLLTDMAAAERAFEEKNYKEAKKQYLAVQEQAGVYEDLDLSASVGKKLRQADLGIEISTLMEYAVLLEGKPDYKKAIQVYEYVNEMLRIQGKTQDMQEVTLNIFRLEQLLQQKEEEAGEKEEAREEKEKAKEKQAKEEEEQEKEEERQSQVQAVGARKLDVDQAVMEKDFDRALSISKEMRESYLALEAYEEADEMYQTILNLMSQREEEEEKQKKEEQAEELDKIKARKLLAEQALLEGDAEGAREIYWNMCTDYIELGQVDAASEIMQLLLQLETTRRNTGSQDGNQREQEGEMDPAAEGAFGYE